VYDGIAEAKTIWRFREELKKGKVIDSIFYRCVGQLERKGIIRYSGSIVDATCVEEQP
jgi:hypothetical protein